MADLCSDNRFELIEKYKQKLIEETNIESAPDEMKVLDNILFRFWQMDWLDKLEQPSAQNWIPCSETIDIPENEVLCCDRYGNEIIGYLAYEDEQWLCESDAEMMYDPVAWREKPEPWKGEQE